MTLRCPSCGAKQDGPPPRSGDAYCARCLQVQVECGFMTAAGDYTEAFFAETGVERVVAPDGRLLPLDPESGNWVCSVCWTSNHADVCWSCAGGRESAYEP